MRILFLASDYPSPLHPTRGTFNDALAKSLAEIHDIRVINPISWIDLARDRKTQVEYATMGKVPVWHPVYLYPPRFFRHRYHRWMIRSIRGAVDKATEQWRPDVVLSYWAHPDGAAAAAIAGNFGVPSAVIVGGSDVLLLPSNRSRRNAVIEALEGNDAVITVNHHLRAKVAELGIRADKIQVWSQGVDRELFHPGDKSAARKHVGISGDPFVFLCVARLAPVKGLDVLIKACQILSTQLLNYQVCVIGDGPLQQVLEKQTVEAGLKDRIRFIGSRSPAELGDWYRAADRTVLPSRSEGLPNVLRESLTCGTRFIASDVGGIREIAGPLDRLVTPEDPARLAEAMAAAASQPVPANAAETLPDWPQAARAMETILTSRMQRPLSRLKSDCADGTATTLDATLKSA